MSPPSTFSGHLRTPPDNSLRHSSPDISQEISPLEHFPDMSAKRHSPWAAIVLSLGHTVAIFRPDRPSFSPVRCGTFISVISVCYQPQPGHPFVGWRNEYQPKGGDALRLGSKGRYGLYVGGR